MALPWSRSARARPTELKSSAVGSMTAVHGVGRAAWTPKDGASLTKVGYTGNVIGFRCVRMVAEAAAALPVRFLEGGALLADHTLKALLRRPNPGQDGTALQETLFGFLLLNGNSYIEAAFDPESGAPMELHALRPDRMRVVPGTDGWPAGYEYRVGARTHRFDATAESQPILHLRGFHPLDDHYGLAPLEAASTAVDVHNAASRWTKALLDNAARPSGAIIYRGADGAGSLTEEQYRQIVSELESNHQGAANAGRPMLLEGGLDWKPMGYSPNDMQFHETRNGAAREIALAFGVPPMLLGLPGDNTYANYQEANRAFVRQTVLPLVTRVSAAVSSWLGWRWGGAVTIEPDLDRIPALSVERDALWNRISSAEFLDDEEKRALLGFGPRDCQGVKRG